MWRSIEASRVPRKHCTALYITPSGLSVLIRELETKLGFRLFDRTTRHVGLTSSGSELLGVVRESLEKLDAAVSQVGQSAAEANLSLFVGAQPLVAADILPAGWGIADGCVCPVSYFEIQSALTSTCSGSCFDCATRFAESMITLLQVCTDQPNKVFR